MSLGEVLEAIDPLLHGHVRRSPGPGRFAGIPAPARAFVLEAIHEGYLLHYGTPGAFHDMDEDLRLLAGDALYALGLARIADEGDLEAVGELADLISLCARARAESREDLAEEAWEASAARLGTGASPGARVAIGERLARGR